jgi:hypothetical protein
MKVGLFVTCLVDLMRPRIGFGGAFAVKFGEVSARIAEALAGDF